LLAATVADLRREGPPGRVWQSVTDPNEAARVLTELPVRTDLGTADLGLALGRRWRHDRPDFWERRSPLGRPLGSKASDGRQVAETASESAQPCAADVPNPRCRCLIPAPPICNIRRPR